MVCRYLLNTNLPTRQFECVRVSGGQLELTVAPVKLSCFAVTFADRTLPNLFRGYLDEIKPSVSLPTKLVI